MALSAFRSCETREVDQHEPEDNQKATKSKDSGATDTQRESETASEWPRGKCSKKNKK